MKFLRALAFIALFATPVYGQTSLNMGLPEFSLNANAAAAPITGTAYAIPSQVNLITWILTFSAPPASHTTNLETSNDNSAWAVADTSSNVAGEARTVFTAARFVRIVQTARSGAVSTTVTIIGKDSSNPAGSGISGTATFTTGNFTTLNVSGTSTVSTINTGALGATTVTSSGLNTSTGGYSAGAASFISIATRGFWQATANANWELLNAAGTFGIHYEFAGVPVIGACGTSPSVSADSTNVSGTIVVGSANPTSCLLTFNGAGWNKAPRCVVNTITTTAADVRALGVSATTTVLTVTPASAFATTTSLAYHCESSK